MIVKIRPVAKVQSRFKLGGSLMYRKRFSQIRLRLAISWLSIPLFLLTGCGTIITPREVNLSLSGRYYEVIELIDYIEKT